jgi:hypothetical protein
MELITSIASHKANSYITLTDAESYFSSYNIIASSDSWNDLTDDKKKLALSLAAMALNTLSYRGVPVTIEQRLAFPRYTWDQVNPKKYVPTTHRDIVNSYRGAYYVGKRRYQYQNFFWATQDTELDTIVINGDISVSSNTLLDGSSSADAFYTPQYYGELEYNQVIKVVGLSTDTYLTVKDIASDGSYVEIKESIDDEAAPSGGVDIYATPIFGYPDEVGYAQAELAYQVINTDLFQKDVGAMPDVMPMSFDLGGTLSARYGRELFGTSKFSKDRTSPLDIVYYLLGPWLASIGGRCV